MSLTDSWLKANHKKKVEKTYERADGEGMSVRVSPGGKLVFQFRFRWEGKAARIDLGTYPAMSLKNAREMLAIHKANLERGRDPRLERRADKLRMTNRLTNEELLRLWFEEYCSQEKHSHLEILRTFEIHVFPVLGSTPADDTPTYTWVDLLEAVKKKAPSISARILQNTKQCHRWAHRRQLIAEMPLAFINAREDLRIEKQTRGRALSDEEIYYVWNSAEVSRMNRANKLFVQLCLLLGCRNGELRALEPSKDFDLENMLWTLPVSKNKTRRTSSRPIVRPIIPELLPYIEECKRLSRGKDLLLTNSVGGPLADGTALHIPYAIIRNSKKYFDYDMEHWSLHDLRKTARTNFSQLVPVHVAELMLGHSLKGMQGVYDFHDYLDEQREAYKAWYDKVMTIVSASEAP